jgi:hypothetical protein
LIGYRSKDAAAGGQGAYVPSLGSYLSAGGFGGGGGAGFPGGGGGGGGYTGGSGGYEGVNAAVKLVNVPAGGGGSYISTLGAAQSNQLISGENAGEGRFSLDWVSFAPPTPQTPTNYSFYAAPAATPNRGEAQYFTARLSGIYDILGYGAQGGGAYSNRSGGLTYEAGGDGAEVGGQVYLKSGEKLKIIVGVKGGGYGYNNQTASWKSAGGGGGTFVLANTGPEGSYQLLMAAGGGGGASQFGAGGAGYATTDGDGSGGSAGLEGGGGGGGFKSNGGTSVLTGPSGNATGLSGHYVNSGTGGISFGSASYSTLKSNWGGWGGFYSPSGTFLASGGFGGGGGAGASGGGGGGGYSGGAGGYIGFFGKSGGGGSYLSSSADAVAAQTLTGENAGSGSVRIDFVSEAVCYREGTRILTHRGEVAVEKLILGDLAVTTSAERRPIRWLGHRALKLGSHPWAVAAMPIQILAHALGPDRPARDLYVSPGHGICVDISGETLIPASSLINGSTIRRVDVDSVTYWHVELDSHDILLAENLPAESYIEMGNRGFFSEAQVVALDAPPDARDHDAFCRPFQSDGPLVDAVRERLRIRALALGWRLEEQPLGDLHLVVDGARVEPAVRGLAIRFTLPARAREVWLVSHTSRPRDIGAAADARELGVCLRQLTVHDGFEPPRQIDIGDPRLSVGFGDLERDGALTWRWSLGRALLPATLWDGVEGEVFLRIDLVSPALPRWMAPPASIAMSPRVGHRPVENAA